MAGPVPLNSAEGETLLKEVLVGGGVRQPLISAVFVKQVGRKNCGVTSTAHVFAAREVAERYPNVGLKDQPKLDRSNLKYHEESLFNLPDACGTISPKIILEKNGMTLDAVYILGKVLCKSDGEVTKHHAADVTPEIFREQAKQALSQLDSSVGVVINYHMGELGQGLPFGHHSPLGAYHEASDRFLILDTWPDTEVCWAKTEDLFKSMNTVDSASGLTRGYVIVRFS